MNEKTDSNSLRLLGERRFLPFFLTQFLGAFNDNVFKNAMLLLVTFHLVTAERADLVVNLSAALFILPFFLFSAVAGQLSERGEKSAYMQKVKLLEIAIMAVGAAGFLLQNVPLLMFTLFMMGTQSAFFGPAKYSILPQQLHTPVELVSGNALVEAGTFLAILLGTLGGGILVAMPGEIAPRVAAAILAIAALGYLASRKIPPTPVSAPGLKVNWNPAGETRAILVYIFRRRQLLFPIIGISQFWFFGALFLTQLPNYTRHILGGDGTVATVLLSAFSLGIGIGSFLCEKLCARKIKLGLVPVGAIGMSVFAVDLGLLNLPPPAPDALLGAGEFLAGHWRVPADMLLMALCGGLYIVPLYTVVQSRCEDRHRSRVIAGNNILNAAFMVAAALFAIALLQFGLSIPQLFLATAGLNVLVLAPVFLGAGVFDGDGA